MKKWLVALGLVAVLATSVQAATKEEFTRYVLMAKSGQMKSEIKSDTDEIKAKFFYLGDEPVEASVVVLEVRFFTSNISVTRDLSMTAQKWLDEFSLKVLSYNIELLLNREEPMVEIYYYWGEAWKFPMGIGGEKRWEGFTTKEGCLLVVYHGKNPKKKRARNCILYYS